MSEATAQSFVNTETEIVTEKMGPILVAQGQTPAKSSIVEQLGPSAFMDENAIANYRKTVKEFRGQIELRVRSMGSALNDPNLIGMLDDLIAEQAQIAYAINGIEEVRFQRMLVGVYMNAVTQHFPDTTLGFSHMAGQGLAINFFRFLEESDPEDQIFVDLPVPTEDGGIRSARITADYPEGKNIVRSLILRTEEFHRKRIKARINAEKALALGTTPLLQALETQKGEAVCFVPERRNSAGTMLATSRIRVSIHDGLIEAIEGIGTETIDEIVEWKLALPIHELGNETLHPIFVRSLNRRGERKLMETYRFILREGIAHARAAKIEEDKANAYALANRISWEQFDLGAPGLTNFILPQWNRQKTMIDEEGSLRGTGEILDTYKNLSITVACNSLDMISVRKCDPRIADILAPYRDFTPAMSDEFPDLPYSGLGVLGAMLRTMHAYFVNIQRERSS